MLCGVQHLLVSNTVLLAVTVALPAIPILTEEDLYSAEGCKKAKAQNPIVLDLEERLLDERVKAESGRTTITTTLDWEKLQDKGATNDCPVNDKHRKKKSRIQRYRAEIPWYVLYCSIFLFAIYNI